MPGTGLGTKDPTWKAIHVLLVDDDESVLRSTRGLLERRGYRVTADTKTEKILEAFRANPSGFDLLLTDFSMPVKSGIEVACEARTIRPDLPVCLFSGRVDDSVRRQAALAGIQEVVNKASVPDLYEALGRLSPPRHSVTG